MLLNLIFIIVGIVLVLWGADRLTEGSVAVAERMNIPQIVIGLTVVAMGTSKRHTRLGSRQCRRVQYLPLVVHSWHYSSHCTHGYFARYRNERHSVCACSIGHTADDVPRWTHRAHRCSSTVFAFHDLYVHDFEKCKD